MNHKRSPSPAQPQPRRYEIKIPCQPHYRPQVQAWVRLHPAHWRIAYPPRQINNVYFDTVDCRSLNENLGGVGMRGKLRLRWYGPCLHTITNPQLELKYKSGAVGWKVLWPLDLTLELDNLTWPDVHRRLREAVDAQATPWLGQLACPTLVNHYQRAYYVTANGKIRLTVDTDLQAYTQRLSNRPNLRHPAYVTERIVIELKAPVDRSSFQELVAALNHFPFRPDRHSKYVQGVLSGPDFDGVELA